MIVDDLVQSGGTLKNAALALKELGALDVSAYVTHAIFPNDSHKNVCLVDYCVVYSISTSLSLSPSFISRTRSISTSLSHIYRCTLCFSLSPSRLPSLNLSLSLPPRNLSPLFAPN